jgi:hypothetical protein
VPRLNGADDSSISLDVTSAEAQVCLAREYGFRTWAELAEAADRAHDEHYRRLPQTSPWKLAEAAIQSGDAARLRALLDEYPGLEQEDPGMTLLGAAAQPEAGRVPREVVDVLVEAASELDAPLNLAACFNKADMVSGCSMRERMPRRGTSGASRRSRARRTTGAVRPPTSSSRARGCSRMRSTFRRSQMTSNVSPTGSTAMAS